MAEAAIDNDVLLKSVCYGFFAPLIAAMPAGAHAPGLLGTARFVLPKLLRKRPPRRLVQAQVELDQALQTFEVLEPTDAESALAAQLEFEAQRQALPVHAGECLLVAIVLTRNLQWLLTGDRAAIEGLGRMVFPAGLDSTLLHGRIACFEQAICRLMSARGAAAIRMAICAEREVDTNLRACFSCASPEVGEASWREGLDSHIRHLRALSGALLIASD
jgi:hypothetical protein